MLKKETKQIDYFDAVLDKMVKKDHTYRKLLELVDFDELLLPFEKLYSNLGSPSEPLTRGFKCLLIQFWHDLSDREAYIVESPDIFKLEFSDKTKVTQLQGGFAWT